MNDQRFETAKAAMQDCANFADRIATMIENGAGEAEPGERVRQVEQHIRKHIALLARLAETEQVPYNACAHPGHNGVHPEPTPPRRCENLCGWCAKCINARRAEHP